MTGPTQPSSGGSMVYRSKKMPPPPTSQGPLTSQVPGHLGHSQPAPWVVRAAGVWYGSLGGRGEGHGAGRVSGERPRPGKHETCPLEVLSICIALSPALGLGSGVSNALPGRVCMGCLRLEWLSLTLRPLRPSEPLPQPQARARCCRKVVY